MSDRELLELAAKAAGMKLLPGHKPWPNPLPQAAWYYSQHGACGEALYPTWQSPPRSWNPLTDDGDALRLAVKLSITVDIGHNLYTEASAYPDKDTTRDMIQVEQRFDGDPYAATRRAIVRAAAELGRSVGP